MWSGYPHWLNPGDNAWQMTAATLVGLMSVPGLVVLYGGVMQKRWSVNSMMLAFVAFASCSSAGCSSAFRMAFGKPLHIFGRQPRLPRQHLGQAGRESSATSASRGRR